MPNHRLTGIIMSKAMPGSRTNSIYSRKWLQGNSPVGLLVFLCGVILIGFAFKLAYEMFLVPPSVQIGSTPDEPLKIESVIQSMSAIFIKILLLVVMSLIGSLVATRGIKLYSHRPSKPTTQSSKLTEN